MIRCHTFSIFIGKYICNSVLYLDNPQIIPKTFQRFFYLGLTIILWDIRPTFLFNFFQYMIKPSRNILEMKLDLIRILITHIYIMLVNMQCSIQPLLTIHEWPLKKIMSNEPPYFVVVVGEMSILLDFHKK